MKKFMFKHLLICMVAGVLLSACNSDDKTLNPTAGAISPEKGASNALLTLTGSQISDVQTIVFEKGNVRADITPTFNTDKAILFRVPTEAVPGEQNIILTNKQGKQFTVAFNVLGYANITDVSNYNFTSGSNITLTGKNLDDVTDVVFTGTTNALTIVSKSATSLVVTFPSVDPTFYEGTLTITNSAGPAVTAQSFVSIDNATQFFTDTYGLNADGTPPPAYQNASWGPASISTTTFKSGTASFQMGFNKGNWSQDGFGWDDTNNHGYKYLSFWMKGGSIDYTLYVWSAAQPGTFNTYEDFKKIQVPANVWTYYKLPVAALKIFGDNNSTPFNEIGWRIQGPDAQDEVFYIDDVLLIKG